MGSIKGKEEARIIYFEPNDILGRGNGKLSDKSDSLYNERLYDNKSIQDNSGYFVGDNVTGNNEDLTMSVDLQVVIPEETGVARDGNRTYLYNLSRDDKSGNYISLLNGKTIEVGSIDNPHTYNMLTTDYTVASYSELRKNGCGDTESLCIKDINIAFDSHFYPRVSMTLVDVRGYALMMPSEEVLRGRIEEEAKAKRGGYDYEGDTKTKSSFFSYLFRIPCPRFVLTIKGYYGNPVTFNLTISSFKSAFDSKTGDFVINIEFIGSIYGLYADLPFNLLVAAPYIGLKESDIKILKKDGFVSDGDEKDVRENYGAFWSNNIESGRFKFTKTGVSDENDIITFTELVRKMNIIGEEAEKQDYGQNLAEYKELSDKIEILERHNQNTENLITALNNNSNGAMEAINDDEGGRASMLYCYRETDNLGKDSSNRTLGYFTYSDSELVNAFSNYEKSLEEKNKIITDSGVGEDSGSWFKVKDGSVTIRLIDTSFLGEGIDDDVKYATILNFGLLIGETDNKIHEFKELINAKKSEASKNIEDACIKRLGFTPNVRNMFRMVFAHVNTFTDAFYCLLDLINIHKNDRLRTKLIKGGITTDLKGSEYLAPFPLIYEGDKMVYPGNVKGFENLDEVKFIDNIVTAMKYSKTDIDRAMANSVYGGLKKLQATIDELDKDINSKIDKMLKERMSKLGGMPFAPPAINGNASNTISGIRSNPLLFSDVLIDGNPYSGCVDLKSAYQVLFIRLFQWACDKIRLSIPETNKFTVVSEFNAEYLKKGDDPGGLYLKYQNNLESKLRGIFLNEVGFIKEKFGKEVPKAVFDEWKITKKFYFTKLGEKAYWYTKYGSDGITACRIENTKEVGYYSSKDIGTPVRVKKVSIIKCVDNTLIDSVNIYYNGIGNEMNNKFFINYVGVIEADKNEDVFNKFEDMLFGNVNGAMLLTLGQYLYFDSEYRSKEKSKIYHRQYFYTKDPNGEHIEQIRKAMINGNKGASEHLSGLYRFFDGIYSKNYGFDLSTLNAIGYDTDFWKDKRWVDGNMKEREFDAKTLKILNERYLFLFFKRKVGEKLNGEMHLDAFVKAIFPNENYNVNAVQRKG